MRGWFRGLRRRPAVHVTRLSHEEIADVLFAHAWGLSMDQWKALDDRARADKRLNVCYAPYFTAGANR